jgi:Rhomboid family
VFGIFGALGALVLLRRSAIPRVVLTQLGKWAGSFVAYNLLFGFTVVRVNNAAHLGGLVGGAIAGALLLRPLVPDRPRASRRALAVAAAGSGLVLGVALLLPRPVTLYSAYVDYSRGEAPVIGAYNHLAAEMTAQRLDRAEAARQLGSAVLAGWRANHAQLSASAQKLRRRPLTPRDALVLDLLEQLATSREEATVEMIAALRAGDDRGFADAARSAGENGSRLWDEIVPLLQ